VKRVEYNLRISPQNSKEPGGRTWVQGLSHGKNEFQEAEAVLIKF